MSSPIHIATRKSPLALKQTAMVQAWLEERVPGAEFAELRLSTKVDERLNWSLEKRGGIGLFTKELEDALLGERASLAVHSAKDLPTTFQADLCIAGYLPRARANDVLVYRNDCPEPKMIGTSSPRRRAQLGLIHPQAKWTTIRGNVGTRLRKICEGEAEGTLLAAAGLDRLGIESHEGLTFVELPLEQVVPAPGQAAVAIQCREAERSSYEHLFCKTTKLAVTLERAFLRRLGGGCQTPVGAHFAEGTLLIYHPDTGHRSFKVELNDAEAIEPALDSIFNELNI